MTWLIAVALLFQLGAPRKDCVRTNGKTACGYSCLQAHGDVACAATSTGVCVATSSSVMCWDPPPIVKAHYKGSAPQAECMCRQGACACGYRCTGHGDTVRCASTPDGVCLGTSRGITCWDPEPTTYCASQEPLPRPACVSVDGNVACGYACEARNGQMACASTPAGRCTVYPERIICLDPEPPPMCGAEPCTPEPAERTWCPPPPASE